MGGRGRGRSPSLELVNSSLPIYSLPHPCQSAMPVLQNGQKKDRISAAPLLPWTGARAGMRRTKDWKGLKERNGGMGAARTYTYIVSLMISAQVAHAPCSGRERGAQTDRSSTRTPQF